jgi:REP element-mobilizing transposase RayT
MTAPRQVVPGTTYLVTRRCTRRQFLLRPSRATREVFLYLLAVGARRHGILVHAYCVMSNHYHLVVTDPRAELPAFLQFLHALVARALNAATGHEERFWDPRGYSAVVLPTPEDAADKTAYVLANPVAAGLVERGRMWPGLWSAPELLGVGRIEALRPGRFFDPEGGMPERETLELTVPPGLESAEAFRELVEAGLEEREAVARRAHRRFLGVARVLAQRWWGRPAAEEEGGGLRPRVASRDKWKRIEVLGRLKAFLVAYREAWEARRKKKAGVVFPAGTYQLRVEHGVACVGYG